MPEKYKNANQIQITDQDVRQALSLLGKDKAAGVDGLRDQALRQLKNNQAIIEKISTTFQQWTTTANLPSYLKKAIIINLSKEKT